MFLLPLRFSLFSSRTALCLLAAAGMATNVSPSFAQSSSAALESALRSEVALVFDLDDGYVLYEKHSLDL